VPSTRGPLPAGVYWRRRLAIISVALVLVLLIGKLLSSGGGAEEPKAKQAGSPTSATATVTVGGSSSAATTTKKGKRGKKHRKDQATETPTVAPTPTETTPPPLPDPTGPCADDDVFVTPSADGAVALGDVTLTLNFQSAQSDACTFDLSSRSVAVKIVRNQDTVWSSAQCPKVVPDQQIVVRKATVTSVPMTWNGKRSDDECSTRTAAALPNTYTISAAVLGGEPTSVDFALGGAPTPTVTVTTHPTVTATPSG
jgi:hypothetical protein